MAPATYAPAVPTPTPHERSAATTITKPTIIVYSRRRKAIAPEWIWSASSIICSVPAGWRFTYRNMPNAAPSPSAPRIQAPAVRLTKSMRAISPSK